MKIFSSSLNQTIDFGLKLAKKIKKGHIFALVGDLGGGKTSLTKGLARGFGVTGLVLSPSFVLMKVYPVKHGLIKYFCHVDLYRLKRASQVFSVGLKEFLGRQDTVTVIEWADKIPRLLAPYKKTTIRLSFVDHHHRIITVYRYNLNNSIYTRSCKSAPVR